MREKRVSEEAPQGLLPALRFEVSEAARILRMSRAQLYNRINDGALRPQKDGARTYITRSELERAHRLAQPSLREHFPESRGRAPMGAVRSASSGKFWGRLSMERPRPDRRDARGPTWDRSGLSCDDSHEAGYVVGY